MKRAYLGGTFDPVTYGHLRMAEQVMETIQPDKLYFLPCHKPNNNKTEVSSDIHRYNMLTCALIGTLYEIDDRELSKKGTTYTIDTLRAIREECPDDEIYFVIGADEFENFEKWREPEEIINLLNKLVVMTRPGHPLSINKLYKFPCYLIEMTPPMDISSTELREALENGKSVKYLLPDSVIEYINMNKLYAKK